MAQQSTGPIFRKDFSIFRNSISGPPKQDSSRPYAKQREPPPPLPAKKTRHATLILLREKGLAQAPPEYWINATVDEAVAVRSERNRKCAFFDTDNDAQVHNEINRRMLRDRRKERDERSRRDNWLLGPAQQVPAVLMDMEDVQTGLRGAAYWENTALEARDSRGQVDSSGVWFNRAADEEERRIKRNADAALKEIQPMRWAIPPAPPAPRAATPAPSSARNSMISTPEKEKRSSEFYRSSIFSTITRATTPRSSVLSTSNPSSTPPTSGFPSPALSTDSKNGFWKHAAHPPSPDDESPGGFKLPPPVVETPPTPGVPPAPAVGQKKTWSFWGGKS